MKSRKRKYDPVSKERRACKELGMPFDRFVQMKKQYNIPEERIFNLHEIMYLQQYDSFLSASRGIPDVYKLKAELLKSSFIFEYTKKHFPRKNKTYWNQMLCIGKSFLKRVRTIKGLERHFEARANDELPLGSFLKPMEYIFYRKLFDLNCGYPYA